MKKLLVLFLLISSVTFCYTTSYGNLRKVENKLYIQIDKETNGSYINSIILEDKEIDGYILNNEILKLNFTAPRSELTQMNHYNVEYTKELGYVNTDFFTSFSLDLIYTFEGNDKLEKEGLQFGNTFKFGIYY